MMRPTPPPTQAPLEPPVNVRRPTLSPTQAPSEHQIYVSSICDSDPSSADCPISRFDTSLEVLGHCTDEDSREYDRFVTWLWVTDYPDTAEGCMQFCLANTEAEYREHLVGVAHSEFELCTCNFEHQKMPEVNARSIKKHAGFGSGRIRPTSNHSGQKQVQCFGHKGYIPPSDTPTSQPSLSIYPSFSLLPTDVPSASHIPSANPSYLANPMYDNREAYEGHCLDFALDMYNGIVIDLVATLEDCYGECQELISGNDELVQNHVAVQFEADQAICSCLFEGGMREPTEDWLKSRIRQLEMTTQYAFNSVRILHFSTGLAGAGNVKRGDDTVGVVCIPHLYHKAQFDLIGKAGWGKFLDISNGDWTGFVYQYTPSEVGAVNHLFSEQTILTPSEDVSIEFTVNDISNRLSAQFILIHLRHGNDLTISDIIISGYGGDYDDFEVDASSGNPSLAVDGNSATTFTARTYDINTYVPWLWIDLGHSKELRQIQVLGICQDLPSPCGAELAIYPSNYKSLQTDAIGAHPIVSADTKISLEGNGFAMGGLSVRESLDAKSRHFSVFTSNANMLVVHSKENHGSIEFESEPLQLPPSSRIRLEKVGAALNAFYDKSSDQNRSEWAPVGSFDLSAQLDYRAGIAIASGYISKSGYQFPNVATLSGSGLEIQNITFDPKSNNARYITESGNISFENMTSCTAGYRRIFQQGDREVFKCNDDPPSLSYYKYLGPGQCQDADGRAFAHVHFELVRDPHKCGRICTSLYFGNTEAFHAVQWLSPGNCLCLFDASLIKQGQEIDQYWGTYNVGGLGSGIPQAGHGDTSSQCFEFDWRYVLDAGDTYAGLCLDSEGDMYSSVQSQGVTTLLGCAANCRQLDDDGDVSPDHVGMSYSDQSLECFCFYNKDLLPSVPSDSEYAVNSGINPGEGPVSSGDGGEYVTCYPRKIQNSQAGLDALASDNNDEEPQVSTNITESLIEGCGRGFDCTRFRETDCTVEENVTTIVGDQYPFTSAEPAPFNLTSDDPVARCLCCAQKAVDLCNATAKNIIEVVESIDFVNLDRTGNLGFDRNQVDEFAEMAIRKSFPGCNYEAQIEDELFLEPLENGTEKLIDVLDGILNNNMQAHAANITHEAIDLLQKQVHTYQEEKRLVTDANMTLNSTATIEEIILEEATYNVTYIEPESVGLNVQDERFQQPFLSVAISESGMSELELENLLGQFGSDEDRIKFNMTQNEQIERMNFTFHRVRDKFQSIQYNDTLAPTQAPVSDAQDIAESARDKIYIYHANRAGRQEEIDFLTSAGTHRRSFRILKDSKLNQLQLRVKALTSALPMHSDFLLRRLTSGCVDLNCSATHIEMVYNSVDASADVISPLLDKLSQTLSTIETFAQSLSLSKQVIGVVRRIISFMAKIPGFGATIKNIQRVIDPFANMFVRIVGRFTNFVTKNSSRLLSKIDTVLEAVTKSHLLVGQISSAARVFADVSTNTCIRGVSQEVLGFDIFGKVQEGVSTFLGVAENVGNLLSNLANALTNGAFSAVPPALEFIASKFLPIVDGLKPLELIGNLLTQEITIPWINMPYVIERKGSVKCNSHQGNTHYYQGTLSPLTCWEKASPGWYIPIVSSQTYFKRDCTGGSGSTKLPGSSTMGGTCYNNYEKQSSRFWPPTNEYGWCSGRWGWSYPCRRYSCQSRYGSQFYRDWALYCVRRCSSTHPTLSFKHCYRNSCPGGDYSTKGNGKYCEPRTKRIRSYAATCNHFSGTHPSLGLSGVGCYTRCKSGFKSFLGFCVPNQMIRFIRIKPMDIIEAVEDLIDFILGLPIIKDLLSGIDAAIDTVVNTVLDAAGIDLDSLAEQIFGALGLSMPTFPVLDFENPFGVELPQINMPDVGLSDAIDQVREFPNKMVEKTLANVPESIRDIYYKCAESDELSSCLLQEVVEKVPIVEAITKNIDQVLLNIEDIEGSLAEPMQALMAWFAALLPSCKTEVSDKIQLGNVIEDKFGLSLPEGLCDFEMTRCIEYDAPSDFDGDDLTDILKSVWDQLEPMINTIVVSASDPENDMAEGRKLSGFPHPCDVFDKMASPVPLVTLGFDVTDDLQKLVNFFNPFGDSLSNGRLDSNRLRQVFFINNSSLLEIEPGQAEVIWEFGAQPNLLKQMCCRNKGIPWCGQERVEKLTPIGLWCKGDKLPFMEAPFPIDGPLAYSFGKEGCKSLHNEISLQLILEGSPVEMNLVTGRKELVRKVIEEGNRLVWRHYYRKKIYKSGRRVDELIPYSTDRFPELYSDRFDYCWEELDGTVVYTEPLKYVLGGSLNAEHSRLLPRPKNFKKDGGICNILGAAGNHKVARNRITNCLNKIVTKEHTCDLLHSIQKDSIMALGSVSYPTQIPIHDPSFFDSDCFIDVMSDFWGNGARPDYNGRYFVDTKKCAEFWLSSSKAPFYGGLHLAQLAIDRADDVLEAYTPIEEKVKKVVNMWLRVAHPVFGDLYFMDDLGGTCFDHSPGNFPDGYPIWKDDPAPGYHILRNQDKLPCQSIHEIHAAMHPRPENIYKEKMGSHGKFRSEIKFDKGQFQMLSGRNGGTKQMCSIDSLIRLCCNQKEGPIKSDCCTDQTEMNLSDNRDVADVFIWHYFMDSCHAFWSEKIESACQLEPKLGELDKRVCEKDEADETPPQSPFEALSDLKVFGAVPKRRTTLSLPLANWFNHNPGGWGNFMRCDSRNIGMNDIGRGHAVSVVGPIRADKSDRAVGLAALNFDIMDELLYGGFLTGNKHREDLSGACTFTVNFDDLVLVSVGGDIDKPKYPVLDLLRGRGSGSSNQFEFGFEFYLRKHFRLFPIEYAFWKKTQYYPFDGCDEIVSNCTETCNLDYGRESNLSETCQTACDLCKKSEENGDEGYTIAERERVCQEKCDGFESGKKEACKKGCEFWNRCQGTKLERDCTSKQSNSAVEALGFIYEGTGKCLDSNSKRFNHKWVGQTTLEGCATSCIALGHLKFLVGFSLHTKYKCHCEYTNGPNPPASWLSWTFGNGVGPVGGSEVNNSALCWSYGSFSTD